MLNKIYKLLFDKIFTFKGRSSRKEYTCKTILALITIFATHYALNIIPDEGATFFIALYGLVLANLGLLSLFQYFPLAVRRLHDFNVSGWWILISFIPCGQLIVFWLVFKRGTHIFMSLSIIVPYVTFFLAEKTPLHVSGVLAITVSGLVMNHYSNI